DVADKWDTPRVMRLPLGMNFDPLAQQVVCQIGRARMDDGLKFRAVDQLPPDLLLSDHADAHDAPLLDPLTKLRVTNLLNALGIGRQIGDNCDREDGDQQVKTDPSQKTIQKARPPLDVPVHPT